MVFNHSLTKTKTNFLCLKLKLYKNNVIWGIFLKLQKNMWNHTLFFHNFSDTVRKSLKLWVLGRLVVDKFHFDRLHGCDCQDGLADTSAQTTKQTPCFTQGTVMPVSPLVLEVFVGPKSKENKNFFFYMILTFVSYCNVENTKKILWNELKFGESQTSHFQGIL